MEFEIPESKKKKIKQKLNFIYNENIGSELYNKLETLIVDFMKKNPELNQDFDKRLSEKDCVMICYGDHIKSDGEKPLKSLKDFCDQFIEDIVSTIHILPFSPYSSDDGFSVIDYKKVNSELGSWEDIKALRENFTLMFDAVINHISSESEWFTKYKKQQGKYKNYFIEADPEEDFSKVTRPRAKPLLTEVETVEGKKHVWTTFSPDQIDLNFKEPELLLAIIDILLFYAAQGAEIIRLDAIAFLWKELGTKCIHLEETHKIIQLIKEIFKIAAPKTLILTETNVPHEENISYFGKNEAETDMVYNFSLPPLVLYSFVEKDAQKLSSWAASLEDLKEGNYYFNFLASHDGIGLRPVEGILEKEEIQRLLSVIKDRGGHVSYKTNSDGSKSPYELNISYLDAIRDQSKNIEIQVKSFIASQAIMLEMQGLPAIYLHSLLGSKNYEEGIEKTGKNRTINRKKLDKEKLINELRNENSFRAKVFNKYKKLLKLRKKHTAFSPDSNQNIIELDKRIFALTRNSGEEELLLLNNITEEKIKLKINKDIFENVDFDQLRDLIEGKVYEMDSNKVNLELDAFQVLWLKTEEV